MFNNIDKEINLKATLNQKVQEEREILWVQNKFQVILNVSPKHRVQLQKWGQHTIAYFKPLHKVDKITNTETLVNTLNSNFNKNCIYTEDYLSYQSWCIQGST